MFGKQNRELLKGKRMADELIDIYDENMTHLGTAMKSQAHSEGLWHKAFHCWIVNADNKKVWFQLRGKDKQLYPNILDISAAGHLQAGETAKDGIREIEEELGIKVDFDKLTKLFTYKIAKDDCGLCNREFCPTYVLETPQTLEDIKMQPEEVDGVYEVEIEEFLNLIKGKIEFVTASGYRRNDDNIYSKEILSAALKDFGPHGNDYYIKVMEMIKRYCEGCRNFAA